MFDWALLGLFASAFLSATVLPGNSELALLAYLKFVPQQVVLAVTVATAGNTLGGLSSYWLGRFAPPPAEGKSLSWLRRYGATALLLSWVPVVGDALCIGAGWLRLKAFPVAMMLLIGKAVRYVAIAYAIM
ncbi:YqaA family protein [Chitinivorax sp. B]|uniref:YqaA family protein n=1 Tax=Chitinivorax sp. B TaxID=2502235 RepID=UPI0010F4EE88|nr:YqaA family protein [Chitinivorax sp. B]